MKTCEHCGNEYSRQKKEAYRQYEVRRFCSKSCVTKSRNPRIQDESFKARYRQITNPDGRKILEHRWVMEQAIGRRLKPEEQVHHVNENRLDNRLENLELVTSREHGLRHTKHEISKPCKRCDESFTPHKTKRARATYCPKCLAEWRAEHHGAKIPTAKLNDQRVAEIKQLIKAGTIQRDVAEMFKVTPSTISAINRGHIWKHVA